MSTNTGAQSLISRRAKRLRTFVIVLMISLAAAIAVIWVRPAGVRIEFQRHASSIDPRVAGTAASLFLGIAMFELTRVLSLIASGEYYSVRVVRHFRNFALWLLILALAGFFAHMVQPSREGGVNIAIGIDLTSLLIVGVTLLLFLLARLLERAGEIEQENQEIV